MALNPVKQTSSILDNNLFEMNFENVTEDDEKETKEKYEFIDLFKTNDNSQQKTLWTLLTVGRKYNYPQLLLLLFSDYSRHRITHFIKTKQLLSINNWKKISNPIKTILSSPKNCKIQNNIEQIIYSAINLFQKRLCAPMNFNILPEEKINDSIIFFARHILNGIQLIKNKHFKSQCQLDIWIIPNQIGEQSNIIIHDNINNNDFDNEDESEEESDDESESDETLNDQFNFSNIGQHIRETIDENNYITSHDFSKLKYRFMNKLAKKCNTQNKRYCMIVQKITKKVFDENKVNYNDAYNDAYDGKQEIFMYKPSKEYIIPNGKCEWGINATLTDILPSSKCNTYPKITAKQSLNGKMFVLSLQKDQENEIRAWLYHRNTITRFYPSDILNILPYLFVNNEENQLTKKQYDRLESLIYTNTIPDQVFDNFANCKHNNDKICDDKNWGVMHTNNYKINGQKEQPPKNLPQCNDKGDNT